MLLRALPLASRWELGTVSHEAAAGVAALGSYLTSLAAALPPPGAVPLLRPVAAAPGTSNALPAHLSTVGPLRAHAVVGADPEEEMPALDRATVLRVYEAMFQAERAPAELLLDYLVSRPKVHTRWGGLDAVCVGTIRWRLLGDRQTQPPSPGHCRLIAPAMVAGQTQLRRSECWARGPWR